MEPQFKVQSINGYISYLTLIVGSTTIHNVDDFGRFQAKSLRHIITAFKLYCASEIPITRIYIHK